MLLLCFILIYLFYKLFASNTISWWPNTQVQRHNRCRSDLPWGIVRYVSIMPMVLSSHWNFIHIFLRLWSHLWFLAWQACSNRQADSCSFPFRSFCAYCLSLSPSLFNMFIYLSLSISFSSRKIIFDQDFSIFSA